MDALWQIAAETNITSSQTKIQKNWNQTLRSNLSKSIQSKLGVNHFLDYLEGEIVHQKVSCCGRTPLKYGLAYHRTGVSYSKLCFNFANNQEQGST